MAILEKRKSVNQLPRFERYQDTRGGDRAAALRGETPITSAVRQLAGTSGYGPMGKTEGFNPMGGRGDLLGAPSSRGAGKTGVTSALNQATAKGLVGATPAKGATVGKTIAGTTAGKTAAGTTSKVPGLTSKTTDATTGKSLTSTGSGAAKTATTGTTTGGKTITSTGTGTGGTTGTTGTKTTASQASNLGKTVTSALAGAAIGAGTKAVIDRLTGGTKTTGGTGGTPPAGGTPPTTGGTKGPGVMPVKATDTTKTVDDLTKGTLTSVTAPKTGSTTGATTGKVVNPQTGITTKPTSGSVVPKTVPTAPKTGGVSPKTGTTGPTAPKTGVTAPKTGGTRGLTSTTAAGSSTANVTEPNVSAATNPAYDEDGNLMPGYELDEDGNPVWMGDKETSTTFNPDGTIGGTGNTTETLDDGTTITYDRDGNVVGYTDPDGVAYDADGNPTDKTVFAGGEGAETAAGGAGEDLLGGDGSVNMSGEMTDEFGNFYDADGNFLRYADGSTEDPNAVAYTDPDGNTYNSAGDLIAEASNSGAAEDHSGFTQQDVYGNTYDWDGNLIAYAEGYGPDNQVIDDTQYASGDNTTDDTEYASADDEDIDVGKKGGLFQYAKGGSVDEPIHHKRNSDGTITQMFDDGSHITYNNGGEVIRVAEGGDVQKFVGGGQAYAPVNTAAQYQNSGYLRGADQGRLQSFLNDLPQAGDAGPQSEGDLGGYPISTSYYGGGFQDPGLDSENDDDALPLSTTYYGGSQPSRPLGQTFPAGYHDNGDGTATYVNDEDGSTVTIDADNNIVFVTDANGETIVDNSAELAQNQTTDPVGGLTAVTSELQKNPPERDQSYMPPGAVDQGDGTFKIGNQVYNMDTGKPLYTTDDEGNITRVEPSTQNGYVDNGDGTYTINNKTYDIETDAPLYEERGGTTYDMNGKPLWSTDSAGNIIPPTITSAGSSGGTSLGGNKTPAEKVGETQLGGKTSSAIDDLLAGLNTYGGAGAAGAVVGALLGNSDLFSPNNAGGGNNVDMSKVGVINPRTTDFGIGPANYVGYDQYGTPEAMPELYGNELYQNLNAPGFNEVNPGDYARMDAAMAPQDNENVEVNPDDENVEGMAEGGMPDGGLGMQTYYTFGTPVDPMQNLYNPQPMQQGMPPQAAQNQQQMASSQPVQALPPGMPQGAPQGQNMGMAKPPMPQQNPMQAGPQGLKSGGLPAWSNVPITSGRLNFRHGAPVHGPGDGQSDDIPAMLADGEYVIDADTVAQIGNGSTKAGAAALDKFRENIRAHKRSAPVHKIPPKTKALTSYLKGAR